MFSLIAGAWLAYLVPWFLSRRDDPDADEVESGNRFAESMRVIRRGSEAAPASADPYLELSTPCTRRAALAEVRRAHSAATFRRSLGTLILLVITLVLVIVSLVSTVPLWAAAVPFGLLAPWLALCRYSTRTLNAHLDDRVERITAGWDEDTISFVVPAELREMTAGENEWSIEVSAPVPDMSGALWDPIPVTPPTYASKPLASRTVRTIDLAAPESTRATLPPVAEKPVDDRDADLPGSGDLPDSDDLPRAVGE